MTHIVEHREDAAAGKEVFELRAFQLHDGAARACVVQAYLDVLTLCEREGISTLWVHDPLGLFPPPPIDRSENSITSIVP